MKKIIILFLSLMIMLIAFVPTTVFAASTTVGDAASLISALNSGYTDITVSGGATITTGSIISIPTGTTITFASGGYYLTLGCTINNNGTIINNNNNLGNNGTINNYGSIVNNEKFYNNSTATITNTGTISNIGTFENSGTINNSGTITSSGTWTNNGTYTGNAVAVDNPVKLINGSNITYYTTFEAAVAQINNSGYELCLLKDLTIEGNVTMPISGFTLSGAKTDGGVSTLTVNNGDFNTNAAVVLKDIKLAHTGSGGNFNTYYQGVIDTTKYYKTDLTVQTGVTFSDIDIVGRSDTLDSSTNTAKGSTLNIQGNADLGSNSILNIENINISNGGTLKVGSLQTKKLGFNNGGTLDITGTGGLTVTGTLSSNGSGDNTLSLPAPSDHSGTVYGATLTNTSIGGTSPIKIRPTSGASFSNKSKLIYLNNTNVADNKFVSGVSGFSAVRRTLDSKQYITFINSTNTTLLCAEAPITYGIESFTLKAAVKDGNNAAVTSGTVKFYKGTSTSGGLLATVGLDSSGNAQYSVNVKDNAAVGDNGFYALYEDSSDYYSQSGGTATVLMNAKSLSISGVSISSKVFDGTTAATITGINLSGIVGTDSVTASAIAVFTDAGAGKNKAVDLSDIKLGGDDAGKYTIASTSTNISTTAEITKAAPVVQLTASPLTGAVYGDTISLTASVTCAASGTVPSGAVTFYNGSAILETVACTAEGKAIYTLSDAPLGSYSFSAVYNEDANYKTATGSIDDYIVGKKKQADLTISGVPAEINYGGSPFALSTAGGTGDGAISYEVTTGTSISVDAATGTVTIVGTGKSVVTASKAGTEIYEPISAEVTVDVAAKSLTISGVSVEDKAYDGTTAATISGIILTGIVGTDNVTVSAVAVFTDADTGENKAVDLSDIHLAGSDAGKYTIASTAAAITTKAIISKAVPAVQLTVQLTVPDAEGIVPGKTVSLSAKVTGAANGAVPTGSVVFYKGDSELGTAECTSGQAIFVWNDIPAGTYSLEARYIGDGKYTSATKMIADYNVSKLNQAVLTVSGVPSEVHYGDASFTLSATGGSGDGTVSFAIKSGTSLGVAATTGAVTIAGAGDSIITVTKAGTDKYNPVSVEVNISVEAKSLSINGVSVDDKEYDGTTAAEVTGGTIEGGLVAGDDVTLVTSAAVGQFSDKNIGIDKSVTISGYTIGGADAVNYDLKQPLPLTADIQKKTITIRTVEIKDKKYDGTTAAAVNYVTLNGKVDVDDVYVPTPAAIAVFLDASVGNDKPVNVTGLILAGADAGNYALASTTASAEGNILTDGDVFPPDFSPVEVSIYSGTKITLIMGTTGASVYYTLDGSVPTVASNKYTVPIPITGDPGTKVTIKALAVKAGMANSGIATKEYTIAEPGTFSIMYEPDNQMVKLSWDVIPKALTYKVYNGTHYLGAGIARPDGKYGFDATGLTNGTQYTFTVQALDSGDCIIKTAQANAIPRTVPGAPTGIAATAGNGQATVSFEAPADNGGSTITEYVVTSSPGSISVKGAGSPVTISGLTNGMTYTFTVKAINAAGNGESSPASNAVTPFSPPGNDSDSDDTTTPAATPTVNIITTPRTGNGAPSVTGIVNAAAKDDGKGTATAALTESQVEDALNKALAEATKNGGDTEVGVEIKVTAPAGAKSVEAGIPKAAVDAVAGSKAVAMSISTPIAALSFDGNSLNSISKAAGDMKISVSKVDAATLSTEAKNTVGDRPVFNFNVSSGDKTISQFGGNVTVSVPYTPKAGEDPNAIVIYYINSEGKPEAVSNCAYDPATGTIRFITSHFSTYAVGYNKVSFKDVPANALYAKAVGFVAARGITDGTGNGNFSPEAKLTRGQLLVMLMRAYGISPDKAPKDNFADAGNTWYTGYLAAAKRLGISDGIGNNKYAPEKEITRQEMYTLSYNVLKSIGELPADTSGKTLKDFTDADKVATWAKEAMTFMANNGIVVGNGSRLNPDEKANRAYMAQVLYNLISK